MNFELHIKEQLEYAGFFVVDLPEDQQSILIEAFSKILSDVYSEGYTDGTRSVYSEEI